MHHGFRYLTIFFHKKAWNMCFTPPQKFSLETFALSCSQEKTMESTKKPLRWNEGFSRTLRGIRGAFSLYWAFTARNTVEVVNDCGTTEKRKMVSRSKWSRYLGLFGITTRKRPVKGCVRKKWKHVFFFCNRCCGLI